MHNGFLTTTTSSHGDLLFGPASFSNITPAAKEQKCTAHNS